MNIDLFPAPELSHDILVFYLTEGIDEKNHIRIETIKDENPAYDVLFYLIDRYHKTSDDYEKAEKQSAASMTLSEIENMLLRLLSGNPASNDAENFINSLIRSSQFYRRLMYTLGETAPVYATATAASLAHIKVASNVRILAKIVGYKAVLSWLLEQLAKITNQATSKLKDMFESMRPRSFGVRLAIVAVLMVFIFTPIIYDAFQKDFRNAYVYDDSAPHQFVPLQKDILRGMRSADEPNLPNDLNILYGRFLEGMLEYKDRNYTRTIEIFETLHSEIQTLEFTAKAEVALTIIRDYYFYFGVSHFAVSQSKRDKIDDDLKRKHSQDAVRYLKKAKEFSILYHLAEKDKVIYFLGLSYGFRGARKQAVAELQSIERESAFYAQSLDLINEWLPSHKGEKR